MKFSGKRLRRARNNAGLTLVELGQACGRTSRMISHYEAGEKTPPVDVVWDMAMALGVIPDDFMIGKRGKSLAT